MSRERHPLARRGFLTGLASLPLIGGSVSLVGQPTAAATPVTDAMMWSYKSWLHMEHRMLCHEMAGHNRAEAERIEPHFAAWLPPDQDIPGYHWHFQWRGRGAAGWIDAPQPSTRAAVILSAAGVPLTMGGARG